MSRSKAQLLPSALDPSDALAQLNEGFRAAYAARREAVLAALGPAVAQVEDSLYLRLEGRRMVGPARTRRYHEFKVISHLPLAIQASLDDAGGALAATARARLEELERRAAAATDSLGERSFDPLQHARQLRILGASRAFMAATRKAGEVEREALDEFLRARVPDIRVNLEDATRDQLQTMHATFGEWVQTMRAEQWSQLLVVIGASHMARTGNIAAQYFSVALGERWQGRFAQEDQDPARRILISEAATDEQAAFTLLAMHVFDRRAANSFFGEEGRLGRDVLADAAEQQLSAMFRAQPQPAD